MGLDIYLVNDEADSTGDYEASEAEASEDDGPLRLAPEKRRELAALNIRLCGPFDPDDENLNFRGKVYSAVWQAITGCCLYTSWSLTSLTCFESDLRAYLATREKCSDDADVNARAIDPSVHDPWRCYDCSLGEVRSLHRLLKFSIAEKLRWRADF